MSAAIIFIVMSPWNCRFVHFLGDSELSESKVTCQVVCEVLGTGGRVQNNRGPHQLRRPGWGRWWAPRFLGRRFSEGPPQSQEPLIFLKYNKIKMEKRGFWAIHSNGQ